MGDSIAIIVHLGIFSIPFLIGWNIWITLACDVCYGTEKTP